MPSTAAGWGIGCQRIDPLEGTASNGPHIPFRLVKMLPEDRPVGGYCKIASIITAVLSIEVARG